jgi:hypothetical protein
VAGTVVLSRVALPAVAEEGEEAEEADAPSGPGPER